ncbi:hypothetical protein [Phocaeicola sartorii]|nr:hypothetical protein [Phocaeicola sartorii]
MAAIISRGNCTAYLMNRTEFCTIGRIRIGYTAAITKCYAAGQI